MPFLTVETPAGLMGLEERDGALTRLCLPGMPMSLQDCGETPLLARAREQLLEYWSGMRKTFDLPLNPRGTPFQLRVWEALRAIPWGETRTYRALAEDVGRPRAFRAVGMANHRNPLPILIPCHRVVGSDGSLTGYAGGLALKRRLLELEGVSLP